MKKENVLNEEEKKNYSKKMFTIDGEKTIDNYVKNLAVIYHTKEFPYKQILILGLPMMKYAQVIYSKELCLERIKSFGQILGIKKIITKLENGTELILDLDGENNDS